MLFIVNSSIPEKALTKLNEFGRVIPFSTTGITYSAVAGHADVFLCASEDKIIYAPNSPADIVKQMLDSGVNAVPGYSEAGAKYPASAKYNAVVTEDLIIHSKKAVDHKILEEHSGKRFINVNQGYTRCSLLPLGNNGFITSDEGIYKTLIGRKFNCLLVSAAGIQLPGMRHGMFGGVCGVSENKVFILGSLADFHSGAAIRDFLVKHGYEIIELYDGPLYDAGSIIVIKN